MVSPTREDDATELTLDHLRHGFPNIPAEGGAMLAQAAVVCLDQQAHTSPVRLMVDGAFNARFSLAWSERITEAKRRFWNDLEEATQQGAYAVAILLIRALTGYIVFERSRKGTGFDWWLGSEDNLFQAKARVSIGKHKVSCITFDDLHARLQRKFNLYSAGSKVETTTQAPGLPPPQDNK